MDKYIGKVLNDRYVLEQVVGVGGMAIVYMASDKITGKTVAVKILKDEFVADENFRRRFLNESRAISMLTHKNIVNVIDFNFEGHTQYIVMEYIDGITLKEYIEENKPLNINEAVNFSIQILSALQHAHERGIIHRDIKPQNIMLLEDKSVKVTDFGIARVSKFETVTMTDKAIGTVYYISPEQAKGAKTDDKSDIYSVGVMLYEMITGVLPFDGDSPVSVALKQVQVSPQKPVEIINTIPKGLEEIVLKAMMKDPEKRYATAEEMLNDLNKFQENNDILFDYDLTGDSIEENESVSETQVQDNMKKKKLGMDTMGPILAGMFSAFALVGIIFGIFAAVNASNNSSMLKVPDLVGKRYADIKDNADLNKYFKLKVTYESSDKEQGTIIKQDPVKNTNTTKGETINIVVSNGQRTMTIPSGLVGKKYDAVSMSLKSGGFDFEAQYEASDTIEKGNVIRIEPEEGKTVPEGTKIKVVVSTGKELAKVKVPNVVGSTKDEAINTLNRYNLSSTVTEQYNDSVAAGEVISQDILGGTEVSEGTNIKIVVSLGSRTISSSQQSSSQNSSYDNSFYSESSSSSSSKSSSASSKSSSY